MKKLTGFFRVEFELNREGNSMRLLVRNEQSWARLGEDFGGFNDRECDGKFDGGLGRFWKLD
jgi:hypothetical protein